MGKIILVFLGLLLTSHMNVFGQGRESEPLRIGIIGVVHGHVHGFLREAIEREDIELLGLVEPDEGLLKSYSDRYGVPESIRYTDLELFLDEKKPEAIAIFSNTFDHTRIVEQAAKRGIHAMMEKPLAVNMEHAEAMNRAAEEGNIHVLVNYETTWYASNADVYTSAVEDDVFGMLRKIVVHDGHWGPKEIGVDDEFLEWLTDPVLNGGGALTDFGCYGANLMTWLLEGETPIAVTATTQQLKTDPVYKEVDDETTIIVEYENTQGIIQASWNWPWHRKDMEVYGDLGYAFALNSDLVQFMVRDVVQKRYNALPLEGAKKDAYSYLKAVVRGEIEVEPHDLSSLENNMTVTRILDAARESARTGNRIILK